MKFGFFILGLGIGIALPHALKALVDWVDNKEHKALPPHNPSDDN